MQINLHTKILLTNDSGEILVLKRSYGNKKRDIPWWWVQFPESLEESIYREVEEETWITSIQNLASRHTISAYNKDTDEYVVFVGYSWKTKGEEVTLSEEHEEYQRVSKDDIASLWLTPYLIDFINSTT